MIVLVGCWLFMGCTDDGETTEQEPMDVGTGADVPMETDAGQRPDAEHSDADGRADVRDAHDIGEDASPVCGDAGVCADGEVCLDATCLPAHCDDGEHNGDETDVDCGGPCPPCSQGQFCIQDSDCEDGVCQFREEFEDSVCEPSAGEECAMDAECGEPVFDDWEECSGFDEVCDLVGHRSRIRHDPRCIEGECRIIATTETEECTRELSTTYCASTDYGEWSACEPIDGSCSTEGVESRTVTDYLCNGGECQPDQHVETRSCTLDPEGDECASTEVEPWSDCGGFSDVCSQQGTETRVVTDYLCSAGSCEPASWTDERECTRDTDDVQCDDTIYGQWGECTGFDDACDEQGLEHRSVTDYRCLEGSCEPDEWTDTRSCSRVTEDDECGQTDYGEWSDCEFEDPCDTEGEKWRTVTDYLCSDEECMAAQWTETESCSRTVDDDCIDCRDATTWPQAWTEFEDEVLVLTNEERSAGATCGDTSYPPADPLQSDTRLREAARCHSVDMAENNFVGHEGSDGSDVSDRVDETGYQWLLVGENVASGQMTPQQVVDGWMDSPGHCENIMDPDFEDLGVGYVYEDDDDLDYYHYWTQVFATEQ